MILQLKRFAFYIGLVLVMTGVCAAAVIYNKGNLEVGAWLTMGGTLVFSWVALIVFFLTDERAPAVYKTIHGVSVYYPDSLDFQRSDMERVIPRLVANAVLVLDAKPEDMFKALQGVELRWYDGPITISGLGWILKGKAGVQKGKFIGVQWLGLYSKSALAHEFLHLIDEYIFHRYDPTHGNVEYWAQVEVLNRGLD